MKTIILVGYLSGVVYELFCTNLIEHFSRGNREAFEELMERGNIYNLSVKMIYLLISSVMFTGMIFTAIIWPIGGLWVLGTRIKTRYQIFKVKKKIRKELRELYEKD